MKFATIMNRDLTPVKLLKLLWQVTTVVTFEKFSGMKEIGVREFVLRIKL